MVEFNLEELRLIITSLGKTENTLKHLLGNVDFENKATKKMLVNAKNIMSKLEEYKLALYSEQ